MSALPKKRGRRQRQWRSRAEQMALNTREDAGLFLDFTDETFQGNRGLFGSAFVKDNSTAANNFHGVPYDLLTYTSPSAKMTLGPSGTLRFGAHNLCLQSETFDNASWTKTNVTVSANSIQAPDGATTADTILETAVTNVHLVTQDIATVAGASYVWRFRVRGLNRTRVGVEVSNTGVSNGIYAVADIAGIQQGVAPTAYGSGYSAGSASITVTADQNSFVDVQFRFVAVDTTTRVQIQIDSGSGTGARSTSFAGNTSNGLYLWGAQLTRTPADTTYLSTTSSARYALPFEWSTAGVLQGILVEEARTNNVLTSTDFANTTNWTSDGLASRTLNVTGAYGQTSLATLTENTSTSAHGVFAASGNRPSLSGTLTMSAFLKAGTRRYVSVFSAAVSTSNGFYAIVDTQNWTITEAALSGTGTYVASSLTSLGNGIYRVSVSGTINAGPANAVACVYGSNSATPGAISPSYLGDGSTIIVGDLQLEAGSFATSYIPTIGSTVTRAADNISLATSAFPYVSQPGTLFAEVQTPVELSASERALLALATDSSNRLLLNYRALSNDDFTAQNVDASSPNMGIDGGDIVINTAQKIALGFATNDAAFYQGGSQVGTDTSVSFASVTTLHVGSDRNTNHANAYLRKLMYLPRRMANADLQTLST